VNTDFWNLFPRNQKEAPNTIFNDSNKKCPELEDALTAVVVRVVVAVVDAPIFFIPALQWEFLRCWADPCFRSEGR